MRTLAAIFTVAGVVLLVVMGASYAPDCKRWEMLIPAAIAIGGLAMASKVPS